MGFALVLLPVSVLLATCPPHILGLVVREHIHPLDITFASQMATRQGLVHLVPSIN